MSLLKEKQMVVEDILEWVKPIKQSQDIGTSEMLKCIIAKCESLIKSDF